MGDLKFNSMQLFSLHSRQMPQVNVLLDKCKSDIESILKCQVNVFCRIGQELVGETELKEMICDVCEIEQAQLSSSDRSRHIVIARHLYCYFASVVLKHTLKRIGETLGNRDHTTVIHGKEKVVNLLFVKDELYTAPFNEVQYRLNEILHNGNRIQNFQVSA